MTTDSAPYIKGVQCECDVGDLSFQYKTLYVRILYNTGRNERLDLVELLNGKVRVYIQRVILEFQCMNTYENDPVSILDIELHQKRRVLGYISIASEVPKSKKDTDNTRLFRTL